MRNIDLALMAKFKRPFRNFVFQLRITVLISRGYSNAYFASNVYLESQFVTILSLVSTMVPTFFTLLPQRYLSLQTMLPKELLMVLACNSFCQFH